MPPYLIDPESQVLPFFEPWARRCAASGEAQLCLEFAAFGFNVVEEAIAVVKGLPPTIRLLVIICGIYAKLEQHQIKRNQFAAVVAGWIKPFGRIPEPTIHLLREDSLLCLPGL
jgi:hypothetical protein